MSNATADPTPKRGRGRPKGSRNRASAEAGPTPTMRPMALRLGPAAKAIGVSMTTLHRLINQGELSTVRIGSMRLIPVASIDALLARGAARVRR